MASETEIKSAAQQLINKLLDIETTDTIERLVIYSRISIAQIAFFNPTASLGACEECGTNLRFKTKDGKLYICCSMSPAHCWKR